MSLKYGDIRLIVKENPTWPKANRGHLKKILLASKDIPLEELAAKLNEVYGGKMLAMQLKLAERSERWVNPAVAEIYSRMADARLKANESNGNDSRRRFFEKLEKLHGLEVGGLAFDLLEGELKHFEKEIPLWV